MPFCTPALYLTVCLRSYLSIRICTPVRHSAFLSLYACLYACTSVCFSTSFLLLPSIVVSRLESLMRPASAAASKSVVAAHRAWSPSSSSGVYLSVGASIAPPPLSSVALPPLPPLPCLLTAHVCQDGARKIRIGLKMSPVLRLPQA